jgi:CxxC-x17-CxxC domain-containing protein
MATTAEIIDITGPKEATPGAALDIKTTIRNSGDSPGYFGVSGSYLDGTLRRDALVTPTRVRLDPGNRASFIISFTMPSADTEFLAQAWHGDTHNRAHDDSKRIVVKSAAMSNQRGLISKLVGLVSMQSDFQQRQRAILRKFRLATNQRAKAEAEASALQQKSKKQADDELAQTQKNASQEVDKARRAMRDTQHALSTVGLDTLLEESKPSAFKSSAVDPAKASQGLSHFSIKADQAGRRIVATATEIRNWRGAERERSQLNKALVLLLFACLGFVFFLLGVVNEAVGLMLLGLILPPILLALADTVWNLGKKEPGQGFSGGYLWLWIVAPIAPFVALGWIFASYPASQIAINKRYEPFQLEHRAIPQIRALTPDLVQALAQAESCYHSLVDQAKRDNDRSVKQIEADYDHRMAEARSTYETSWQRLHDESLALHQSLGLIGAPWNDPLWNSWAPATPGILSQYLRIGQLTDQGQWHKLTTPALVPLFGKTNLVIKCSGSSKHQAVEMVRCLMSRLLATVPPGKLRFTLIDPVGLGQSMAAFMNLADYDEALVGGKIWTEPQHIEEQLARLTEHMEIVIQKFLRDKYPTIEDYNTEAGEVAEPYRVLVVVNFPVNFTESAARRLVSIALNGPRCGVYTIITIDTEQQLPYGFREAVANQDLTERRSSPYKRRKMYSAICAACGNECEVPFQPREGRPVYCSECYAEIKEGGNEYDEDDDEI